MTTHSIPRPASSRASLRACAARALVELADRAGSRPAEIDALAARFDLGHAPDLRRALAVLDHQDDPRDVALLVLANIARLDAVELLAVAILLAIEEDSAFVRAVVALQSPTPGTRPTVAMLAATCATLTDSAASALQTLVAGRARASGIVTFHDEHVPIGEQRCALSSLVYLAISDRDALVPGTSIGTDEIPLPPSIVDESNRLAATLHGHDRTLVVRSASAAEARAVAAAIAAARNVRALFVDKATTDLAGFGPYLLLRGLLPVFTLELGPGERKRLAVPALYDGPIVVLAGREGSVEVDHTTAASWNVPIPSSEERRELWRTQLGATPLSAELGASHRHGAGRIALLARSARRLAALDNAAPERRHVRTAAWTSEGVGLGGLAEALPDEIPDAAMVTTPALRRELDLLLARCEAREGLGEELGAAIRARLRPGVRAMFVGPSGTGKTLAASWLATRLSLPLYRVDLSAVTSKYIGETEKNLAQLLARAEHEEIILLFDEADAMFGKRTDIKEANDRFANAQTNFLLQRIEAFDGIVLLTSNSKTRLDPAFTRRLDAVIEFPLPGPEERRALWLAHLGTAHALDGADINRLAATVDLVGGHIRTAVLSAAVLARKAGRTITLPDLIAGLVIEYRKLGRSVPAELQRTA